MAKRKKRVPSVKVLRTILPDGQVVLPRTVSVSTYTVQRRKRLGTAVTKAVRHRKVVVEPATPPVASHELQNFEPEPMQLDDIDGDSDLRFAGNGSKRTKSKKLETIGVC